MRLDPPWVLRRAVLRNARLRHGNPFFGKRQATRMILAVPGVKKRLAGDTARQANTGEVKELRAEATALKEVVADLTLENRLPKKT